MSGIMQEVFIQNGQKTRSGFFPQVVSRASAQKIPVIWKSTRLHFKNFSAMHDTDLDLDECLNLVFSH